MVKLTLPVWFANSQERGAGKANLAALVIPPGSWETVVREVRTQQPVAADRVFTPAGRMAPGFALVLNDEVVHGANLPRDLRPGDELFIIATIAGG